MNLEQEKYKTIYSSTKSEYLGYGHANHGARAFRFLLWMKPTSLLDVGCGHNEFVKNFRKEQPEVKAVGVDFACLDADKVCDILKLPYSKKEFDVVTAFDVLEHLTPEQVSPALQMLSKVSCRFIFSISSVADTVIKVGGQTLHPTAQPKKWWIEQIQKTGANVKTWSTFIWGEWKQKSINPDSTFAVVGNGPSLLLHGKLGAEIDSHDEVIRFNSYKLKGFEDFTGAKTTLWSTFGHGVVPFEEKPQRAIFVHGLKFVEPPFFIQEVFGIDREFFTSIRVRVRQASTKTGEDLERLIPTSGLLVILWLLEVHKVKKLDLYGFDHFEKVESQQHHYYNAKAYGKPKEHDGEAEAKILKSYVESGRVCYCSSGKVKEIAEQDKVSITAASVLDAPKPLAMTAFELAFVKRIVSTQYNRGVYLEIGSAQGGSLLFFSKLMKPDALFISVDINKNSSLCQIAAEIGRLNKQVELVTADSRLQTTVDKVKEILAGRKVDVLFIDGDHTYFSCASDAYNYSKLVTDKGLIIFHDCGAFSPRLPVNGNRNVGNVRPIFEALSYGKRTIKVQDYAGIGIIFNS